MRYLSGVPFQIQQNSEIGEPTESIKSLDVVYPWIIIIILSSLLIVAAIILIRQSKLIRKFSSAELRLIISERDLMHSLINNMPDRIYVKDHKSRFLIANKYVTAAMGVDDPKKVIGKTDFDFYDKEIAEIFISDEKRIMETGTSLINKEEKGFDLDGSELVISTTKIPIYNKENKILGIVGIGRDITKLKNDERLLKQQADNLLEINALLKERQDKIEQMSEEMNSQSEAIRDANLKLEKLSLVASKTQNVVVIMDGNGNFEWVNQGFEDFYGLSLKKFIKKNGVNLRENSFNSNISAILNQIYITRKPYNYNSKTVDKNGKEKWYQSNITPILDEKGEIKYLILIDSDITELKKAEGQIKKQKGEIESHRDKLRLLNATKDRLFSIIAHDLKNPFHSIIGFTELLQEGYGELDEERVKEYVDLIHNSSVSAYQLLQNLLEWALSQTNSINFKPELFSVEELISDAIALHKPMAKIKNIELIDKSRSNNLVYADKNMIRTVIRNLTNNSIKFTNEDGKITYTSSSNKQNTTVKITDTGIGIPSEKLRSLFKLDQISSTTGTAGETGTGLGLILCKEYIEKNKGDFKLKSVPGIGSTFIFILPNSPD